MLLKTVKNERTRYATKRAASKRNGAGRGRRISRGHRKILWDGTKNSPDAAEISEEIVQMARPISEPAQRIFEMSGDISPPGREIFAPTREISKMTVEISRNSWEIQEFPANFYAKDMILITILQRLALQMQG